MAVLPGVYRAPRSLQSRASTGNGLSGGAIAGIVLGSIFGLLLLVAILWTCRLWISISTKAKILSTRVVDEVEKGHACAKDIYTAGRERQFQTPNVHVAERYHESGPQYDNEFHHPKSPMAHPIEGHLPHLQHNSAFMPALLKVDCFEQPPLPDVSSSADAKPSVVDAKRVLGVDDASYLDQLPSHNRSWVTIAPACVASGSQTPFPEAGGVLEHPQVPNDSTIGYWSGECAASKNGPVDDAPIRYSSLQKCKNDLAVYVDPWDVEYQPNPVMFAHLSSSVEATPEGNLEKIMSYNTNPVTSASLGDVIGSIGPGQEIMRIIPSLFAPCAIVDPEGTSMTLQPIDTESSDDIVPILKSELPADDTSLVTTTSNGPPPFKGKERCLDRIGTVELINFAATIPSDRLPNIYDDDVSLVSSTRSYAWTHSNAVTSPSQASSLSSPPSESTLAKVLISSSASTEANTDSERRCPICHLGFRTPGLRRNHENRKHNLRYPCKRCDSKFGLRADLLRHQDNVHRDDLHITSTKLFRCPNIDCTAPGKVYARKDNFKRHVKRCEKMIATGKSLKC